MRMHRPQPGDDRCARRAPLPRQATRPRPTAGRRRRSPPRPPVALRWTRVAAALLAGGVIAVAPARAGVESTVHNLSASGPGTLRAPEVTNVCVFCHTPHDASPTRGLWNHELPAVTYRPYESSTLEAEIDQPTGASRLCLSCHDGTLALGAIRKLEPGAQHPALGPLTGTAVLGTDLSDDHPVSFVYDAQLAARVPELADPALLPHDVRLDETGQLQCTSCHDPHEDRRPKFLVRERRFGELCLSCHRLEDWPSSAHATSAAIWNGAGTNPWPADGFATVAENACDSCHRPHAAAHPERLLTEPREEDVCFACHGGTVASADLRREFRKPSIHPIEAATDVHQPRENPLTMPRHVECVDCHEPHRARASVAGTPPPALAAAVEGVSGVTAAGGPTSRASFEYEVCFKCHGLTEQPSPFVIRADDVTNARLELATGNASYHPVLAIGRNPTVTGFEPGYTAASVIGCIDCHDGDDSRRGGGIGAAGPHGSQYEPILAREYQLDGAPIVESFATYRLCYGCHNRAALLSDAQAFPHSLHLTGADGASCAVCHDAHGSRTNPALVNFMLVDRAGQTVVTPSSGGQLEFQALGAGSGRCFLTCHGVDHAPKEYGLAMAPLRALRRAAPIRGPRLPSR